MIYRAIAALIFLFPLYAHASVTGKPRVIDGDMLDSSLPVTAYG